MKQGEVLQLLAFVCSVLIAYFLGGHSRPKAIGPGLDPYGPDGHGEKFMIRRNARLTEGEYKGNSRWPEPGTKTSPPPPSAIPPPPTPPPGRILKEGSFETKEGYKTRYRARIDQANREYLLTIRTYYNSLWPEEKESLLGKSIAYQIKTLAAQLEGDSLASMRRRVAELNETFNELRTKERESYYVGGVLNERIRELSAELKKEEEKIGRSTRGGSGNYCPGGVVPGSKGFFPAKAIGWPTKILVAVLVLTLFAPNKK